MPANCSGGGTGVFINGRELHPADVLALSQPSPNGQVLRGRFSVNANGDFGFEGGPRIYNLYLLAIEKQQARGALGQNANGGAARNAMDGLSVGPRCFLDRGAGSSYSSR